MTIVTRFDLLKHRRTKIVATVGPSSRSPVQVRGLIQAGVDVFRVNMSHGKHSEHAAAIAVIREQAAALGTHTAILADLCGPKIRTGKFPDGPVTLVRDAEVTVTVRDVPGSASLIPSQYVGLAEDVRTGDRILLNDGAAELTVLTVAGTEVHCRVVQGGPIGDHKGINLPGVAVSAPSLTAKDIDDAHFALAQQVDFIALSFVRTAADVESLRAVIDASDARPWIIAKIEQPEALETSVRDVSPVLGKAKAANPDVLILHLHGPSTALVIKQAAATNLGVSIVAGSAMHQPHTAALLEPAELKGVCAETSASPVSGGSPEIEKFLAAYRAEFNAEPDGFAMGQYDGVSMVLDAASKGARTAADVQKALSSMTYKGLAMTYKSDGKGNMAHSAMIICYDGVSRTPKITKRYDNITGVLSN